MFLEFVTVRLGAEKMLILVFCLIVYSSNEKSHVSMVMEETRIIVRVYIFCNFLPIN